MDVAPDMRAQFYFFSIVLYAAIVGVIAFIFIQPQPPMLKPAGESIAFNVHNLEDEMVNSFGTGLALASATDNLSVARQVLANYTRLSAAWSADKGLSVSWSYNITGTASNATLNCSLTAKAGKTKFSDSFTSSRALLLLASAWHSGNYTHVNLTVHNETGRLEGLTAGSFGVVSEGQSLQVQPLSGGYYGNISSILSAGAHTASANVTDSRGLVARATATFTVLQ